MNETKLMQADDIATAFNSVVERQYWRANLGGTRLNPEVHFTSRASMVRVIYNLETDSFTVSFSKTSVAFGDFMASTYRSLTQVLACLKAAGLPFACPADDDATAVLRIAYDPRSKAVLVTIANMGDMWLEAEPMPFKVPERNTEETSISGIDGL